MTGMWLDMATAMIASVAIGIAVDDTIHVYHGFRERIRKGVAPTVALARSYHGAGRAVVVTTVILSAQFLILVLSDFVPTRNFGLLTTIGLVTALLFDLLLLPAILIVAYGRNSPVAAWLSRLPGRRKAAQESEAVAEAYPGPDPPYWTAERRLAVVREIISGKTAFEVAAREYTLPQEELAKWLAQAERALADAFDDRPADEHEDPEKLRALAKAYRQLKAENRQLKARLD